MKKDSLPNIGEVATAEIDGLSIRYARGGVLSGIPVLLTAPWPESIYSFYKLIPQLISEHPVLAVDLPGFGLSQSRPDVMAPEAMGDFLIKLLTHFGIEKTHAISPDVGTPAVLFAASKKPKLFESLIIGGAAMQPDMAGGVLKDLVFSPPGALNGAGSDGVKDYLDHASKLTPMSIIEDFRAASSGNRLEEAVQFVRGYIPDSPKLEPLLSKIDIPVLIIAGKNDPIVPVVNQQFLADRLPHNQNILLDAEHRVWEEAAVEYNEKIVSWIRTGYLSFGIKS
jgi:pimeloyl-ACP methyl ester carboxylesterase